MHQIISFSLRIKLSAIEVRKKGDTHLDIERNGLLTWGKVGIGQDGVQSVVDQFAVHQEPKVTLDGGLPLGDWLRPGLLLPFLGLVLGVQPHGHEPHLLHEPLPLSWIPLLVRRLRRRRRRRRNNHRRRRGQRGNRLDPRIPQRERHESWEMGRPHSSDLSAPAQSGLGLRDWSGARCHGIN